MKLPLRLIHLMRAGWAFLALCAVASMAIAQEGWDCSGSVCIEADSQIARNVEGSFTSGVNISPERQIDRFAALEQQRWMELRFEVLEPTLIEPFFVPATPVKPSNWPSAVPVPEPSLSILVSQDSETYAPLEPGSVVQPGSFLSVLVGQGTVVGENGMVHFFPSDWTLTLASRRVVPQAVAASSALGVPALVPSGAGLALGCESLGCGTADSLPSQGIEVAGEPDPDPKPAPDVTSTGGGLVANDMARELQTELARVGCYTGAIDGLWGPNSRGSVAAFNLATGQSIAAQDPTPSALVAVARQAEVVCDAE